MDKSRAVKNKIALLIIAIIVLSIILFLMYYLDVATVMQQIRVDISIANSLLFLMSGVIDGINPCALSMLLFFIMIMAKTNHKNTNVLVLGILFASGTFVAYFFSGIGALRFIKELSFTKYLPFILNGIAIVYSFTFAALNFKDAFYSKRFDLANVTLQLPSKNKKLIHDLIKRFSDNRLKSLAAFALGFLVTLAELLCTGQVYLAAIIALSNFSGFVQGFYLLVFNIGFIIPILIITAIIHLTKETMDMTDVLLDKLWVIKIITGVLMLGFGIYVLLNFISFL